MPCSSTRSSVLLKHSAIPRSLVQIMRNACHLKEGHPWGSCCSCLEEKTRRCWLHSLLAAVWGSTALLHTIPCKCWRVCWSASSRIQWHKHTCTHKHVPGSSFTLWFNRRKSESFPVSPDSPTQNGTLSFLCFWLKTLLQKQTELLSWKSK